MQNEAPNSNISFFAAKADIKNDQVRRRSNNPPWNSSLLNIRPCQQHKEEHHQDHDKPHQHSLAILEKSSRLAGKVFAQEKNQLHDVPHSFRGLASIWGSLGLGVLRVLGVRLLLLRVPAMLGFLPSEGMSELAGPQSLSPKTPPL